MPRTRTPHLLRRGDGFYFRRAVPLDLRERLCRVEIRYSLKTQDLKTAKIRCRFLSNIFDKLMQSVGEMPELDKNTIDDILRHYFAQEWSKLRDTWLASDADPASVHEATYGASRASEEVRGWLASQSYPGYVQSLAKDLAVKGGANGREVPQPAMKALCEGIGRAWLDLSHMQQAMIAGYPDQAVPKDTLFAGLVGVVPGLAGGVKLAGITAKVAVAKYAKIKFTGGSWTEKTKWESTRVLNWFLEVVGSEADVALIRKEHVREFRDLLDDLPANYHQKTGKAEPSIKGIVAAKISGPRLGYGTRVKYLSALKAFLGWCHDEGYLEGDPASGIKVHGKAGDPNDARHPFTKAQLEKLFHSPQYTGHKSAARRSEPGTCLIKDDRYWIPLVFLMSGMRPNEIVQLRIEDIKDDDGVRYFDVNKEAAKTLKTASSARVIPIHPILLQLGFMAFVEAQKAAKSPGGWLFPEFAPKKAGIKSVADKAIKYFGRYLDAGGVKSGKTSFYSFRHNFEDALRDASINVDRQKALMGHAEKSTTGMYGKKLTAKQLAEDMAKVQFPVDLGHLRTPEVEKSER